MKKLLLILSLSLGLAFPAFADNHLPPPHEILSDGKILHKEVHYQKDSEFYQGIYELINANQIVAIDYVVVYQKKFFNCKIWSEEHPMKAYKLPYLTGVDCILIQEQPTFDILKK